MLKYLILTIFFISTVFAQNENQIIKLTLQEKEYLQNKKEITMCVDPDWMPFEMIKNGKHIGLASDYIKIISKDLGTPITLVKTNTWAESIVKAKNRECDIYSMVSKTPSREKYMNFTIPYIETPIVIATKNNNNFTTDIKKIKDKKVGIVKGYSLIEIYKEKYPDINIVEVNSIKDGLSRVEKGEIFGYLDNSIVITTQIQQEFTGILQITGKFDTKLEFGIASRNDEKELVTILDKAIKKIDEKTKIKILNDWIKVNNGIEKDTSIKVKNITLNENEKQWISKGHVVKIIAGKVPPYQMVNNGKVEGISVDYIKYILDKNNIKYKFIPDIGYKWKDTLNKVKNKDGIDLILSVYETKERSKYIEFTTQYEETPSVIFTRDNSSFVSSMNDLNGKTIASEIGFIKTKDIKSQYPNIKILDAYDTNEALLALSTGKVDAYIGNLTVGSYIIKNKNLNNIKVAAPSSFQNTTNSMGVRKDWSPLASIISKELKLMTSKQRNKIKNKYFNVKYEHGISFEYLLKWIFSILIVSSLIIYVILKINKHLKNKVKEEIEKNKQQQLMMLQQSRLAQMGEMISMIAHQWRQPLNSLAMLNQSIVLKFSRGKLNKEFAEYFKTNSNKQIQNMSKTIDDFRDFFKPEKEKVEFIINNVISDTLEMVKPIFSQNKIDINFDANKEFKTIGYPNELGQAILNIVNNAQDALIENNIENKQTTIKLKKNDTNIILTISDNAGGIPQNIIDKIFDPYFSTKDEKNGTGLGLYMTKIIIEEHMNGKIKVENINNGAKFSIILNKMV